MITTSALSENIRMALSALTANKLRAILTMLGIIIGVAAVITLLSVGRGVERYIGDAFGSIGTNLLFVLPGKPDAISSGPPSGPALLGNIALGPAVTIKDADALKDQFRVPDVAAIAPEIQTSAAVVVGNNSSQPIVSGVTPDYAPIRSWVVIEGRFVDDADVASHARVAVIGQTVLKDLFPNGAYPIGQALKIKQLDYKVIGVLDLKGGSSFGDVDNQIYIPLTTAHADLYPIKNRAGEDVVSYIYAQAVSDSAQKAAIDEIKTIMRERHNISYRDDDDFSVFSQADFLKAFAGITAAVTVFLSAIAAISLLVGGIGIMNIMLVTVTERTHEIGLRKAVGAKQRNILFQFLIEAMTLSLLGGLIGIAIGLLGSTAIGTLVQNFKPEIQIGPVLLATGFSLAVGLFFGLYPAVRASRLNPIDALRYE
ncbi:MAG TPA: ABC transporter permease [Anaerolineae bacterium]|nr:ABC transporter permease [Anaerolineae bacterium]